MSIGKIGSVGLDRIGCIPISFVYILQNITVKIHGVPAHRLSLLHDEFSTLCKKYSVSLFGNDAISEIFATSTRIEPETLPLSRSSF